MDLVKAALGKNCSKLNAKFNQRDLRIDPVGYFLIRVNPDSKKIELGFCKQKNLIDLLIRGDTAEEVYHTFANQGITLRPDHMAYLGKELTKAEIAKKQNIEYIQDSELNFQK